MSNKSNKSSRKAPKFPSVFDMSHFDLANELRVRSEALTEYPRESAKYAMHLDRIAELVLELTERKSLVPGLCPA